MYVCVCVCVCVCDSVLMVSNAMNHISFSCDWKPQCTPAHPPILNKMKPVLPQGLMGALSWLPWLPARTQPTVAADPSHTHPCPPDAQCAAGMRERGLHGLPVGTPCHRECLGHGAASPWSIQRYEVPIAQTKKGMGVSILIGATKSMSGLTGSLP